MMRILLIINLKYLSKANPPLEKKPVRLEINLLKTFVSYDNNYNTF